MYRSRKEELEHIREKILEAIRFSKHYWMIYQKNTFGFSTILDLNYKKSYIEVLLFPSQDVLKKAFPLVQINTPIETEFDFNQIIVDPDFDDDGLISPRKIINRIDNLIFKELEYHINILKNEIELLNEEFENYSINDISYFREVYISFPNLTLKLEINFEFYPLRPIFYFSKELNKIVRIEDFVNSEILINWDEFNPPHIVDVINNLINLIVQCKQIQDFYKNSQHLLCDNIIIGKDIEKLSFKVHRGQSIGFLYKGNSEDIIETLSIKKLFNIISGKRIDFSGVISIFGKFIQLTSKKDLEDLIHIQYRIDPKLKNMKLKKAIRYITKNISNLKNLKNDIDNIQFEYNYKKFKNVIHLFKGFSFFGRIKRKKEYIDRILESLGLLGKKKIRLNKFTHLDIYLFLIAQALFQNPRIIMLSIPKEKITKLEQEQLNRYLELIKKIFHIAILIHGPEKIVAECEKIVTITGKKVDSGTMKQLLKKIPQSAELISIELNYPDQQDIKKLFELGTAIVIEERKFEKYKLFPKEDPNNIIKKIIHIFGKQLQSFKRYRASLHEFVEFLEIT